MPTASPRPTLDVTFNDTESVIRACAEFREIFTALRDEIGKVLVGQDEIVNQTLVSLFAGGHALLEGVPGLGKTLLIRALSDTLGLTFARIQFTPDLMPADITGTSIVVEDERTGHRTFKFSPGPIFHQLVLADEINRATPKSQSALLEAMQERSVTVAGQTHQLEQPFFVMATQNPIEQEGTYALPEAQLDRFFFKIAVPYANRKEMNEILDRTTTRANPVVHKILDGETIMAAQKLARRIIVVPQVQDYAIRLVLGTHPTGEHCPDDIRKMIHVGVSPRGAQALITAAKVQALVDGRYAASFHDVQVAALPALRHRIIRSFEAEADGITTDSIIDTLVAHTPREQVAVKSAESEFPSEKRHGCLTTYLWFILVASVFGAIINMLMIPFRDQFEPTIPVWGYLYLTVGSLAMVVCIWALFNWKRWGFYGIVASSLITICVNLFLGLNPVLAIGGTIGSVALLWLALQIGGVRAAWSRMK